MNPAHPNFIIFLMQLDKSIDLTLSQEASEVEIIILFLQDV